MLGRVDGGGVAADGIETMTPRCNDESGKTSTENFESKTEEE